MEKINKDLFPKSTLYPKEYSFESPIGYIDFKALTYREVDNLHSKYSTRPNALRINTVKLSLIDPSIFHNLSQNIIDNLFDLIIYVSTLTKEEFTNIEDALHIMKEEQFEDKTFKSCKLCQESGYDKLRNCPMLGDEYHSKDVFYLVNNKKLDKCPMDGINNNELVSDAISAYIMYKDKMLPIQGGLVEQTTYFFRVAPMAYGILYSPSLDDIDR